MRKIAAFSVLLSGFMLNACAYSVHDVYVSGFEPFTPKSAGKVVTSHAEQFVVLGFKGNTDYLEAARNDLEEQCPKGDIVGIVTEYQTALGFMSWHHHIYMKGLCTNGHSAAKKQAKAENEAEKRPRLGRGRDFLILLSTDTYPRHELGHLIRLGVSGGFYPGPDHED